VRYASVELLATVQRLASGRACESEFAGGELIICISWSRYYHPSANTIGDTLTSISCSACRPFENILRASANILFIEREVRLLGEHSQQFLSNASGYSGRIQNPA
jgi:hypothetical protein